jgi:Ran GTPase-activating protein (RanGAP) involved in mRNA processing and transport
VSSPPPPEFRAGQRWRHSANVPEFEPTLFIAEVNGGMVRVVVELTAAVREELEARAGVFWIDLDTLGLSGLLDLEEPVESPGYFPDLDEFPEDCSEFIEPEASLEEKLRQARVWLLSLEWGIQHGRVNRVRRILEADPTTAQQSDHLHQAIRMGNLPIVQLFIDHGVDVSAPDGSGTTPLHVAAEHGNAEMAEFLLLHGADAEARDKSGWTAAARAARSGVDVSNRQAFLETLLARGAVLDLNTLLRLGRLTEALDRLGHDPRCVRATPQPERLIHDLLAYLEGVPEEETPPWDEVRVVLTILIDEGIDPNADFPLARAVRLRSTDVARLLLESGADPNQGAGAGNFLEPRGHAMRELVRRFGARGPNDPETIIRERGAVRDEDHQPSDTYLMNVEGRARLMYSTPEEKAQLRYARAWLEVGQYERALRYIEQVVERDAGDLLAQQLRAWILATCPDEHLRDGTRALRLAGEVHRAFLAAIFTWANDGSGERWQNPAPAEALAAAYGERQQFRQALAVLGEVPLEEVHPASRERIERMRASFEAGEPYHEPPPAPELAELGRRLAGEDALAPGDETVTVQAAPEFAIDDEGHLSIHRKGFGVAGVRRLLAEPRVAEVQSLRIVLSGMAVEEILLLAEGLVAPGLRHFDLSSNGVRDKAGAVLLAVTRWPELRELKLNNNRLGRRTAAALAGNPALPELTKLDVADNHLRVRGATALADAQHLGNLSELNLNSNVIRDEGLCRLAASPHLTGLKVLHLLGNRLHARGMEALASAPLLAGLTELDLGSNRLDDAAACALAAAPEGQLETLNLWSNRIGPAGAAALAAAPLLASVRTLTLSGNPIGLDGIRALAAAPRLADLESLHLSDCPIDEAAATALAESATLEQLESLHVSENQVSEEVQAILRQRFGEGLHF